MIKNNSMKKWLNRISLIIVLGIIANTALKGQDSTSIVPIDSETNKITYKEVVTANGTIDDLYVRGIAWINSFYPNPTGVTKIRNRDDGVIQGIARFKIYYIDDEERKIDAGLISYSIKLEFREGRYRYTITDFNFQQTSRFPVERWLDKNAPAYNPQWDDYIMQLHIYTKSLIADLTAGMVEKVKKADEW